jgi:beta-lactamase class A
VNRAIATVAALVGLLLALYTGTPASPAANPTPAAGTADRAGGWRPDVERARNYARSRAGGVSFAFVDLDGRSHKYRAGETAALASVFKTMLLAAYLRQKDVRDRELRERDRDLLGPMIRVSDNEAATEVNSIVGAGAIERLAKQAGMRRFSYDPTIWGNSRGAPRELARFIQRIDRVIPRRHEGYARKLLSSIAPGQRWGVGEARPKGWRLYFKGGWGSGTGLVNHQIALLERGRCSVAMALFTTNSPSHSYGSRTLEWLAGRLTKGIRGSGC